MIIDYTLHLVFWILTQFTSPGAEKLNFEMKSKLGDSTFQVQRTPEGFLLLPPPDHTDEPSMTIAVTDTTVVHMDQVLDLQKND